MAFKQYLVDLDLSKNQLLNAVVQNLATAPVSPNDGQIYWNTTDNTLYVWNADGSAWIDLGSDGITNLGYTANASQGTITSSTGTNAIIPLADGTNAGLMSASEKSNLSNQSGTNSGDNAENSRYESLVSNVSTNLSNTASQTEVTVESSDGNNTSIAAASTSQAGVMTKAMFDEHVLNNAKVSNVPETLTSLSLSTNTLTYTDENGNDTDLDLSLYLDDTNLARLTSGSIDGSTGIATFTRDDASTFTIDMSAFLDGITVNDTLTSTSTTEGLSANQGKVLKDLIDTLPTQDTNTQLSDGDIAAMGYIKTDTNTQRTDAEIEAVIAAEGYVEVLSVDCAAATSTTVTHSFGQYPTVNVYKTSSPFNEVEAQVVSTNATTVVVTFNTAPTAGQYKIVVKG